MHMFGLRLAVDGDVAGIRRLLEAAALPVEDLADSRPDFVVAESGTTLVGVVGLQGFGDVALLRSLAVAHSNRGAGVGSQLVSEIERLAHSRGVRSLVLLTTTAEKFFAGHGYQAADRAGLPEKILATAEFRSLCPASAACMFKPLP